MLLMAASYGTGERKNLYSKFMLGVPNRDGKIVIVTLCGHGCTAKLMKKIQLHVERRMTPLSTLDIWPSWLDNLTLYQPDMVVTQPDIDHMAVCVVRVNYILADAAASIHFPRLFECYTNGEKSLSDVIRFETIMSGTFQK